MGISKSWEEANRLDAEDPLRSFRDAFLIPQHEGRDAIYFLGNSLGLQPKNTASVIDAVLKQWQTLGVEAFFEGAEPWLNFHDKLTTPLARIVGANPQEIVVMNQLTVNLHLMLVSFFQPQGKRTKILCEAKAFPSDQYMLETHLTYRGLDPQTHLIEVSPRQGTATIELEDILVAIEQHRDELALVLWGGVNYYTGQVFDINAITEATRGAGAIAGFDLAHAAGNIPLQLHNWNVDFACWCNYKYLNGGPGAVAAAFIHERHHHNSDIPRFAGWWGYDQAARFEMKKGFQPTPSAEGWALSTPSPLLFASLHASLKLFEEAGFQNLLQKSRKMQQLLLTILHEVLKKFETPPFSIITPEYGNNSGAQVSLLFSHDGRAVFDALKKGGVFADWREPDVIRMAPVPLYNSFTEIVQFCYLLEEACEKIFKTQLFKNPI